MFKIDLLSALEKPPRSHPLRVAAMTVAFVALAALVAFDAARLYECHRAAASAGASLAYYDRKITELAEVAAMLDAAEKDRRQINASLAEVSKLLPTHRQWSATLVSLAEGTPELLLIVDLTAKREEQKVGREVSYRYSLLMGVISPSGSAPVEAFVRALQQRMSLESGSDGIRIVAQRQTVFRGQDVPYYVIECRLES